MSGIEKIASWISKARCTVALTGAGISTPSGLPDFRGPKGLWRRVDPSKFELDYFLDRPDEIWMLFVEHFLPHEELEPNPAHLALARLEEIGKLCAVVTQNVDGLHQRAGNRRVVEIHGNLRYAVCMSCGARHELSMAVSEVRRTKRAPRCPSCGGLLRPDVVFFGEPLPKDALMESFSLASSSDLFLAIGTSLAVSPANQLPLEAKRRGARLVIINEGPTEIDDMADIVIRGRLEMLMPEIVELVSSSR